MNQENTQRQKQVDIDVLKIFVSGSFVKEDFLKTHGMKFNPNYELQMEFSGLGHAAKYRECTRHLEKKRKCSTNKAPWGGGGGGGGGGRTRIQCVRNEGAHHEVLAFIGVTADRHVVQT